MGCKMDFSFKKINKYTSRTGYLCFQGELGIDLWPHLPQPHNPTYVYNKASNASIIEVDMKMINRMGCTILSQTRSGSFV
jgi:hypothetical protein